MANQQGLGVPAETATRCGSWSHRGRDTRVGGGCGTRAWQQGQDGEGRGLGGGSPAPASQARRSAHRTPPQGRVPALFRGAVVSVAVSWCCRPC